MTWDRRLDATVRTTASSPLLSTSTTASGRRADVRVRQEINRLVMVILDIGVRLRPTITCHQSSLIRSMTQPQSVVLHGLSELQRQHQDVFGMNFKSRAASIEEFNKAVHDALNRVSAFNEETMIRAQHAGFQWLVCLTIFQYIFSYGKVTPVLDKEQIWKIWDKHANVIFQACCEAVSQRRYSDILSIGKPHEVLLGVGFIQFDRGGPRTTVCPLAGESCSEPPRTPGGGCRGASI
jgi:hypothetical protein